jgi:hypothetical protein
MSSGGPFIEIGKLRLFARSFEQTELSTGNGECSIVKAIIRHSYPIPVSEFRFFGGILIMANSTVCADVGHNTLMIDVFPEISKVWFSHRFSLPNV